MSVNQDVIPNISDGLKYLAQGYIDYSLEVITNRALPDLRDGLKPVQRRLIQIMNEAPDKLVKCATLAGQTLALSPHTDDAVYAALVLMTDVYGASELALIHGSGNFGGVYKTDPPAAKRYTEARLSPVAKRFFENIDGVKELPNFDSTRKEFEVLASPFPYVLVKPTSGIAVGFATNIPSFNFVDVCNLVKEYIKDGKCSTVIAPDFTMGGSYIKNDRELMNLMTTGKAKLRLRGKYKMRDAKNIEIYELPYGQTAQGLLKQINDDTKSFSKYIRNAYDSEDFEHGMSVTVECTAKDKGDEVMYLIGKDTDFNTTLSANITVLDNGVPKTYGVWTIIRKWVSFRRDVIKTSYQKKYNALKREMAEVLAFMELVNDRVKCETFVDTMVKKGKDAGWQYIVDNFSREQIPWEQIKFVCTRSLDSYKDGGQYAQKAQKIQATLDEYGKILADPLAFISKQMDEFIAEYGKQCKRKTEILESDFALGQEVSIEEKLNKTAPSTNAEYYFSINEGFMQKSTYPSGAKLQVKASLDDTILMFDNRGRILRAYLSDMSFGDSSYGCYLPKYFNLPEDKDFRITYATKLEPKTLFLIYKDGNVGFVDTKEWVGNNRRVKVLQNGISTSSAEYLGAVLEEVPQVLQVCDQHGNFGWVQTSNLIRKSRTGKTRAFTLRKNRILTGYSYSTFVEMMVLPNNSEYNGKLHALESNGIVDVDSFTSM